MLLKIIGQHDLLFKTNPPLGVPGEKVEWDGLGGIVIGRSEKGLELYLKIWPWNYSTTMNNPNNNGFRVYKVILLSNSLI